MSGRGALVLRRRPGHGHREYVDAIRAHMREMERRMIASALREGKAQEVI